MKPYLHANQDVKRFGGIIEDYIDIHNFLDCSYQFIPDVRHRALLHNQFGLMMVEKLFGDYRVNSDGKKYSPRSIAENHILSDVGIIPTVEHYFKNLPLVPWMSGTLKRNRKEKLHKADLVNVD